jgi:hypothetical protein
MIELALLGDDATACQRQTILLTRWGAMIPMDSDPV